MIQEETKQEFKTFEGDLLILESPEMTMYIIVIYIAMQQACSAGYKRSLATVTIWRYKVDVS